MNTDFEFKCEACKMMRSNKYISVIKVDLHRIFNITHGQSYRNVNYCNDEIDCLRKSFQIAVDFLTKER